MSLSLFEKSAQVMIVDETVSPFSRIWCLFEVKRLTDLQKDPPGAVTSGAMRILAVRISHKNSDVALSRSPRAASQF